MRLQRGSMWLAGFVMLIALGAGACSKSSNSGTMAPPSGKELDSGDFGPGAVFSHQFTKAGTFGYHCIHHAPMVGTIVVADSGTVTTGAISITSSTSPFPGIGGTLKTGSTVTWTNNSSSIHTVTSD